MGTGHEGSEASRVRKSRLQRRGLFLNNLANCAHTPEIKEVPLVIDLKPVWQSPANPFESINWGSEAL
jgi:hypothetical protein